MSKIVDGKYVPTYQEDYHQLHSLKFWLHKPRKSFKLSGTYKDYKTIKNEHLRKYPKEEAKFVLLTAFRNTRDDLWIKHDLIIKHFKANFN